MGRMALKMLKWMGMNKNCKGRRLEHWVALGRIVRGR
jgi:hypothetical protein